MTESDSKTPRWLIYGANGYTGRLTAEAAVHRGLRPLLAGRRQERVAPLARELGLEYRVFSVERREAVAALQDVELVLHMAGPFSATSRPMVDACFESGCHYLDITGEIDVFEDILSRDARACDRGIILLPGVGFDVVPTDCLAAMLAHRLPDAHRLHLAFGGRGGWSAGTLKTMLESVPAGGRVRENGRLRRVPLGWKTRKIPFPRGVRDAVTIPWGDVSTAHHSTGIPNIQVYQSARPSRARMLRLVGLLGPVLGFGPVQDQLRRLIDQRVAGPTPSERERGYMEIWGEVKNRAGVTLTGALRTPEGYGLTVDASLAAVERVLSGQVPSGAHTPSGALGRDFVLELPGIERFPFIETF